MNEAMEHATRRMADIAQYIQPVFGLDDVELGDDGTLDTLLIHPATESQVSIGQELAAEYRCERTGELDLDAMLCDDDVQEALQEAVQESFSYYGLDLSWSQDLGCWVYLLSTGGPHEEIRIYGNGAGRRIVFTFKDWGTCESVDVTDWDEGVIVADWADSMDLDIRDQ